MFAAIKFCEFERQIILLPFNFSNLPSQEFEPRITDSSHSDTYKSILNDHNFPKIVNACDYKITMVEMFFTKFPAIITEFMCYVYMCAMPIKAGFLHLWFQEVSSNSFTVGLIFLSKL